MSRHLFFKRILRLISVCLCVMLTTGALAQEQLVSALPTPTPEPTPFVGLATQDEPVAQETTQPQATPEAQQTQPATDAQTESPAPSDTATVPQDVSETPIPTPTQDVAETNWDESQCDHMNPQCEKAPKCNVPGCQHIGLDENGDVAALCKLGEWLLNAADTEQNPTKLSAGITTMSANAPIQMALREGVNTIYRSGTYELTQGSASTELHIRKGLAVSLLFKDVKMLTLRLMTGVTANLSFEGGNTIETVAAPDSTLTIDGTGYIVVKNNLNCEVLNVLGGNVSLPAGAVSQNGRERAAFWAGSATQATVDGEFFTEFMADDSGGVWLWLPKLRKGLEYQSKVKDGKLVITSEPEEPANQNEVDISGSEPFSPQENGAYRIIASNIDVQNKTLTVNVSGVSLSMKGIGTDASAPSITAEQPLTLFLSQNNQINELNATKPVKLSGDGTLQLKNVSAPGLTGLGALTVSCSRISTQSLENWQQVTLEGSLTPSVKAKLNGKGVPLLYDVSTSNVAYVAVDDPNPGYGYSATLDGNTLTVEAVPTDAQALTLTDAGLVLESGNYIIQTTQRVAGTISVQAGANVLLTLDGVQTSGGLTIGASAKVDLRLNGASRMDGALDIARKVKLEVSEQGALVVGSATGTAGQTTVDSDANLSLQSGTKLPGSKLKPTKIRVTDDSGAAMAGKLITLKLGGEEPYETTTDANGHITLWRSKALSGIDVVVLSHNETYATIMSGGGASPDAVPVASATHKEYGEVTVTAEGAGTLGIQYYVGSARKNMPDAYVSGAKRLMAGENGVCNIPGLKNGQVVTYRAIAAVRHNAELTAKTADGFGFSEQKSFTVANLRKTFSMKKQTKTYDKTAFQLKVSDLPAGATVAYYHGNTKLDDGTYPTEVGSYVAKVTVPVGCTTHVPGTYDVEMEINRIVVEIYPDEAAKIQGEEDPPFTFAYDESLMLEDDAVSGTLTRKKGEYYGNYPYLLDRLTAASYYELRFAEGSPCFFVDWGPHHYMPYDPFKKIDPVYDELTFSTGETIKTQISTVNTLTIGDVHYGSPVTDTQDGKKRPFTPTLRLKGGYDQALLILTAEPELAEDGGYLTDADGNRIIRGRRLRLSYYMLSHFARQKIAYIAFSLNGATVLMSLESLTDNEALATLMEQNNIRRAGTTFSLELEPVDAQTLLDDETSAAEAASLREPLMRIAAYVENAGNRVDISTVLKEAQLLFDASELLPQVTETQQSDVTETVNGRVVDEKADEEAKQEAAAIAGAKGETETDAQQLELTQTMLTRELKRRGSTLVYYTGTQQTLDTKAVVPYTSSEAQAATFRALLRTRPYLTTSFAKNGLYGVYSQAQ